METKSEDTEDAPSRLIPRLFHLERTEDVHGMSGTGIVAEGIEFSDGQCVLKWLSKFSSTCLYPSILHVEHIHGHEGRTRVVYDT